MGNAEAGAQRTHAKYWTLVTLGALFLVATTEFFLAQIIAQRAWPGYSIFRYDISALGVTQCGPYTNGSGGLTFYACSPLHTVMNTGFVLLGILMIAGVLLTRPIWPRRRLITVGVTLVALSGLGPILAGLFPANVNLGVHALGALLNFLTASVGLVLLGIGARSWNAGLALWSIVLGATTFVGLVLYSSHVFLGIGPGGMERVVGYPSVVWAIGLGIWLLAGVKRAKIATA